MFTCANFHLGDTGLAGNTCDIDGCGAETEWAVVLRFESSDMDEGDKFLYALTTRGILSWPTYRAGSIFPRGDDITVPASRVQEVQALADEAGISLNPTTERDLDTDHCMSCGSEVEADPDGSVGVIVHARSLGDEAYDLDEDHAALPERED